MTPPPSPLSAILDRASDELDQIEAAYGQCRGHAIVVGFIDYLPTEEGCLFALWDAWTRFLRELVMLSSSGPVIGLSGAVYTPAIPRNEQATLAHLTANKNGRNYRFVNGEPNWNNEQSLVDIMDVLDIGNAQTVLGAVAASWITLGPIVVRSPLPEIRAARNFSAHKHWKTLIDISAYSTSGFTTLSAHLREPRSGVEAFSEWKECLLSLASSASQ